MQPNKKTISEMKFQQKKATEESNYKINNSCRYQIWGKSIVNERTQ